jgi:hypothetical protein
MSFEEGLQLALHVEDGALGSAPAVRVRLAGEACAEHDVRGFRGEAHVLAEDALRRLQRATFPLSPPAT